MDAISEELKHIAEKLNLRESVVELSEVENCSFGFIGEIINGKIKHSCGILNFKIKIAPGNIIYRNQLMAKQSYANEIYFYTKIQECFNNFQKEKLNEKDIFEALPKYYSSCTKNKKEFIVLEDLHVRGFVNRKPSKYITDSEMKLILLNYAKFHAISFALKDQKREVFNEISKNVFKNLEDFNVITQQIMCVQEQCKKIEPRLKALGVSHNVLQALKNLSENNVETALGDFNTYRDELCCIIHGDAWNNNIMIKYDKNDPIDIRIIDFQAVRLGSIIEDLSYFMFTCCDKNQLKNLDNYLKYYHEEFSKFLTKLGSNPNIFTYQTLLEHWRKHCYYGLSLAIVVLHGMNLADNEFPNPMQVLVDGEYLFRAFNKDSVNEGIYLDKIRDVLEFSEERNFI